MVHGNSYRFVLSCVKRQAKRGHTIRQRAPSYPIEMQCFALIPSAFPTFCVLVSCRLVSSHPGALSNHEDIEAIVHGMGPLRLAARLAANSPFVAPTATVIAPLSCATPSHSRVIASKSENRRRFGKLPGVAASRSTDRSPERVGWRGINSCKGGGGQSERLARGEVTPSSQKKTGKRGSVGRGAIPPPIETRVAPNLTDEPEVAPAGRCVSSPIFVCFCFGGNLFYDFWRLITSHSA